MKNLVCPLSSERISDLIPRISGSIVVFLLFLYVLTNNILIPAFLLVDFFLRGFTKGEYSPVAKLSRFISANIRKKGKLIDKAPKIFAARLGFIFTFLIFIFQLTGLSIVSETLSYALILFAGLECVANFCVGCWIFTLFVLPLQN